MEKLRQLFYLSRADSKVTDSEVRQILQASQRNNSRKDITGCLLYSGRHFAQVLEGGFAAIDDLVARIAADKRHNGFVVAIDHQVTKRKFPSWFLASHFLWVWLAPDFHCSRTFTFGIVLLSNRSHAVRSSISANRASYFGCFRYSLTCSVPLDCHA